MVAEPEQVECRGMKKRVCLNVTEGPLKDCPFPLPKAWEQILQAGRKVS